MEKELKEIKKKKKVIQKEKIEVKGPNNSFNVFSLPL